MRSIGQSISEGAMAFLRAEYRVLTIFVFLIAILLGFFNYNSENSSSLISLSFVTGAIASGLAGYIGMKVATKANNRTTNAAKKSLSSALNVAFTGGSVMGMSVVGLGVLGLTILFILYTSGGILDESTSITKILNILSGFSLEPLLLLYLLELEGGYTPRLLMLELT